LRLQIDRKGISFLQFYFEISKLTQELQQKRLIMNASIKQIIFYFLFICSHDSIAQNQWQPITGLYGSITTFDYAESSNKVFAIGAAGVYLSSNMDFFWEVEPEFTEFEILAIEAKDDSIFVVHRGLDNDARPFLSVSYNEGSTWQEPILVSEFPYDLIHLSYVANQLVIATSADDGGIILKSNDLGQTWSNEAMPEFILTTNNIWDKNESHIVYSVQTDALSSMNFVYSVIEGTWSFIPETEHFTNVYSYIYNNRIFTAYDDLTNFNIHSCALDGTDNQLIYSNGNLIEYNGFIEVNGTLAFLITEADTPYNGYELYVSNDVGQTFNHQTTLINTPEWIGPITILESGECILQSGPNLELMSVDFLNYQMINDGLIMSGIDYVKSANNVIYASKTGIYLGRSNNEGVSFENQSEQNQFLSGCILQQGDTLLYLTSGNYVAQRLNRSFDNGNTFDTQPILTYFDYHDPVQKGVIINDKTYLFFDVFLNFDKILKSEDYGVSWTETSRPSDFAGIIHGINGMLFYLGDDLYRYNEQTDTWQDLNCPINNYEQLNQCKMRSMGNNLWIKNDLNQQVILMEDGVTWITPAIDLLDVTQIGNTIYGLGSQFLYASNDFGQTWLNTQISVPNGDNLHMTEHGSQLLVYGGNDPSASIWKIDAPQITLGFVSDQEKNTVVHPNPSHGLIKLTEYTEQTIQVTITDLSGKLVAINSSTNGELDLSRLNPGIYLGVIQAAQGQSTKRFKVVKM
jgi:hypothetical protein